MRYRGEMRIGGKSGENREENKKLVKIFVRWSLEVVRMNSNMAKKVRFSNKTMRVSRIPH